MIKKTSMIVLFFLTIFLISSVSAAEIENETSAREELVEKVEADIVTE